VEALFDTDVSAFDLTTTFGLMMVLSVLAGTLSAGSRIVWAAALAGSLSLWVIAVGSLLGEPSDVTGLRAVIASTGVIFSTALVSKLFDQLSEAIDKHDRSARLQDAIARCSEALLVQTDAFATYEAVKALLEASDADYAYIDRTVEVDGDLRWEITADAARRPAGYGNAWRTGSYSAIPSTRGPLLEGKAVVIHTKDLEGEELALYEADGVLSEATVPIFVAGVFRGSIGFIQYTEDRRWTEVEIQTLWRASHMIGAYWARQEYAQELRASNESKERLLASVSHEIRTPLTAIVGLSEEISASRTSLGAEELDELNGIIAVQSRELAELVEDLLVASRADFGNLSIKPEVIDLRLQAERVLQGVRESHRTGKALIPEGDQVFALADPLRVRQILRNLLTNAIKYGGDKVIVSVRSHGELAQVLVSDDGPGVPAHESALIFERYYRSAESPTQPGSVGIGLSVSRQLAEMMGGTLDYVHGEPHPRFELSLPLAGPGDGYDSSQTFELTQVRNR
ncbi:MAG: GAF domain-containing sensor histidine kinase, partial [Acidimicrobiia bacterium]